MSSLSHVGVKTMDCKSQALLLCTLLLLLLFGTVAQKLPPEEVEAFAQIASKLEYKGWDRNVDPCSETSFKTITKNITCDCSYQNSRVCHIKNIKLQQQNLTGMLPKEFANLTFLEIVDLSRNALRGTIPAAQWASLNLKIFSIQGNLVSGTIPKELGNITTLTYLNLEDNLLQWHIPLELGNLTNLERLYLAGNNLSGTLPATFSRLTNIQYFLLDGNPLTGRIPDFVRNWRQLIRFDMQGTSMEGPIPSAFSLLENLSELRISDLKGPVANFPSWEFMKTVKILVLRNCQISGKIPPYIGINLQGLRQLDLSFNKLTGSIPSTFQQLPKLEYMYLANNQLSGAIPDWVFSTLSPWDISNNNFSDPPVSTCSQQNVNLVASYSNTSDDSAPTCSKNNLPCSGKAKYYSLFINCGGSEHTINNIKYEEDTFLPGPSTFYSTERWAYSSMGSYMDVKNTYYVATNSSPLSIANPTLYMTARNSPLSLTYYGFCLQKGNYSVKLHFSEIIFTNDSTLGSVGRRVFDVYIQDGRVLKDFNIEDRAGGVGREIVMNFTAEVTSHTLIIHFYWAGKGTTTVPSRGVYGPLISAITVTPNFKPDLGPKRLSIGAIVGIALAFCATLIVLLVLWARYRLQKKKLRYSQLSGQELQSGHFRLGHIIAATSNFSSANKIGEGGFGPVYKGTLFDGTVFAVKQLSSKSKQGNREFLNEIAMVSALNHPNLVKLYGCCVEGSQLLLLYEYMENNSLANALFGQEHCILQLDWQIRRRICLDIARGLAYLHEESRLKMVHRDIKATNILLDKDLNAKISDFGLAKLDDPGDTHISTRIAGTLGYIAPEYVLYGRLTQKADIYSFGVLLLEIVCGKSNTKFIPSEQFVHLLDWAYVLQEEGNLLDLVDTRLGSDYSKEEALNILNLALMCTENSPTLRPAMSAVVTMLEAGKADFLSMQNVDNPAFESSLVETMNPSYNKTSTRSTEAIVEDEERHQSKGNSNSDQPSSSSENGRENLSRSSSTRLLSNRNMEPS